MHPKDKIPTDQKKDLVYHWECKADGCNSSYIGETSRALGKRVKEHSKSTTSAILKHCKDFYHLLPSISDFRFLSNPSQITREAKEAIQIRRLDPNLNQNIGKMSIPHCFDPLLRAKPKHPPVGALSQVAPQSVDEVAPPSQIPGLNLTQFNNIGTFRPNVAQHIPKPSTRACRARNLLIGTVYPNIPLSSASLHGHPRSSLGATLGVRMSTTAYGNLSTMSSVWPIGTSRLNLRPRPLSI